MQSGVQSLRLSSDNEQNLCNLAHCWVLWGRLSPPSRERQGGVKRVPQAFQACILTITRLTSTRLPGRSEARPYNPRLPGRTEARPYNPRLPDCIEVRHYNPRLPGRTEARPYDPRLPGRTKERPYDPRLPGRTEARSYDRMVFSAMYYVDNKQSRVAACCDLPGDSFSFCKVSDLART